MQIGIGLGLSGSSGLGDWGAAGDPPPVDDGESTVTHAETTAFAAAVVAAGGTTMTQTEQEALDTFYGSAKPATWWPKMTVLYCRLGDQIASMLNLADQTTLAVQAGDADMPWTPTYGWEVGANNQSVDLGVDPSAVGGQNNASVVLWYSRLASAASSDVGTTADAIYLRFLSTGAGRVKLHSGSNANFSGAATEAGLRVVVRDNAATLKVYHAQDAMIEVNNASVAPSNTALALGGYPSSDSGVLAAGYATAMTATEVEEMRNAIGDLLGAFAA